jgi:hypothetical protein
LLTLKHVEKASAIIPPVLLFSKGGELLGSSMEDPSLSPFVKRKL